MQSELEKKYLEFEAQISKKEKARNAALKKKFQTMRRRLARFKKRALNNAGGV